MKETVFIPSRATRGKNRLRSILALRGDARGTPKMGFQKPVCRHPWEGPPTPCAGPPWGFPPTPCAGPRPLDRSHKKELKKLHKMVKFRASETVWASSYGRFTFQSLKPLSRERAQKLYRMVKFRASGMVWASSYGRFTFQSLGPICRERAQKTIEIHPITSF